MIQSEGSPSSKNISYSQNTHDQLLQQIKNNINFSLLPVQLTSADDIINHVSGAQAKLCIDLFSMLIYLGKSSPIFNNGLNSTSQKARSFNQNLLPLISHLIFSFKKLFNPSIIIVVFPRKNYEGYHLGSAKVDSFQWVMANLLKTNFNEERVTSIYQQVEDSLFCNMDQLFNKLSHETINPFKIKRSQSQFQFDSQQQESQNQQINLKVLKKVCCPKLDHKLFRKNPCGAQLMHLAGKGYTCFTWSQQCINYLPVGTYVIGLKVEYMIDIGLLQMKNLQMMLHKQYDEGIFDQCIDKAYQEQNNILYTFKSSQCLLYNTALNPVHFRTDHMFLHTLTKFSPRYNINQEILQQIRNGKYQIANWQIRKTLISYLLVQMHPVCEVIKSGQVYDTGANSKNFRDGWPAVYEADICEQQAASMLQKQSNKYIFIHRFFEPYIDNYLPTTKIKKQKFDRPAPIHNTMALKKDYQALKQQQLQTTTPKMKENQNYMKQIKSQTKKYLTKQLFRDNCDYLENKKTKWRILCQPVRQPLQEQDFTGFHQVTDQEMNDDSDIEEGY